MALIHLPLLLLIQSACVAFCQEACTSSSTCRYPYIIILDAGSTGTRINVYRFQRIRFNQSPPDARVLSEKRKEVKPGLDSMAYATNRIGGYLKPLLDFAKSVIPAESQSETYIFLGATAGVRKIPFAQRSSLMSKVADEIRKTPFKTVLNGAPLKDKHLAILLSGKHEGELAAAAVNILMGDHISTKYGMLDLGGGSVQISKDGKSAITILGLGMSAATLQILGYRPDTLTSVHKSPCLNPSFTGTFSFGGKTLKVAGDTDAARWDTCTAKARDVLAKFKINYGRSYDRPPYVAMSTFFHVAKTLNKLGHLAKPIPGQVTVQDFQDAAKKACINPPVVGKYEPYVCLDGAYITQLLKVGFKLDNSDRLFITNKIKGISPGWSVELARHFIKNPTAIGSSVFGTDGYNEGRAARK